MQKTIDFKLIIYIGPGKSGSSAIQSIARQHSAALAKQRCCYMGVMFENSPVQLYSWQNALDGPKHIAKSDVNSENELFQLLRLSIEKLIEDDYQSALWVNESTLKSGTLTIKVLNRLAQSGIKIVTYSYVRCHEDLIQSAYIQWGIILKKYKGPVKPFKEWVKQYKYLLYPFIQNWLNQDFKLVLKNYDAIDDVVFDFFQSNCLEIPNYQKTKINARPNSTLLSIWAEFNSLEDQEKEDQGKIAHDFKKIANPSGILGKQSTIPHINDLLPSALDIEEMTKNTREDKESINQLLKEAGQPALSSPPIKASETIDPFKQLWELHMYSLDMIFSLQKELSEHKEKTKNQLQKFGERMSLGHTKITDKMTHNQAQTTASMTHNHTQLTAKVSQLEAKLNDLQNQLEQLSHEKLK